MVTGASAGPLVITGSIVNLSVSAAAGDIPSAIATRTRPSARLVHRPGPSPV